MPFHLIVLMIERGVSRRVDEVMRGPSLTGAAVDELTSLFEVAEAYGFADWILFDASVVRGLAYYTGIVFEGFDRKGELRAICGGGRYDKLLSLYGSPEVRPGERGSFYDMRGIFQSHVPKEGLGVGDDIFSEFILCEREPSDEGRID